MRGVVLLEGGCEIVETDEFELAIIVLPALLLELGGGRRTLIFSANNRNLITASS